MDLHAGAGRRCLLALLVLLASSPGASAAGRKEKLERFLRASALPEHAPKPWKEQGQLKSSSKGSTGLPQDGRVAIVLRGQSFRRRHLRNLSLPPWKSCIGSKRVIEGQMLATTSLVEKIVAPLERAGNEVDLVVTDGPCSLRSRLRGILGSNRTVREAVYDSPSQVEGIRFALEEFKYSCGGRPEKHKLILVTRHDIIWKKSIDTWGTDFSNFNFLSRCEESLQQYIKKGLCTNDIFHMMPGWLFNTFDSQVGKGTCFNQWESFGYDRRDGHECYPQVQEAVGQQHGGVSFVMDWFPNFTIQGSNDFYGFVHDG